MALKSDPNGARVPALAWALAPIYAASLALLFIGERVVTSDGLRYALSGAGVAGAIVATALRFAASSRASGERRAIERSLALLSALGLVAIGLYFTSTDTGKLWLGLAKAEPATRARVEGATLIAWIALLVVALLPLLLGELALAPMRRSAHMEARRVRAAIAAALSVAFALVYVGLFTYAAGELDAKIDFSYFRTGRPSDSTKKMAESSTDPIKVTAFFPQINEVGTEVDGYLRELHAAAPSLKIETYDRLLVPAIAKEAKVNQDGVLVLTRGNAKETLVIGAEKKTSETKLKTLDADFQKALLKVMREAHVAYFTVGHGEINEAGGAEADERSGKLLRRMFESQNFTVKDLGLTQGLGTEVPDDATMVAVLGPARALLPEEIASLKRYAEKGGHLLLALDPAPKVDLAPLADLVGLTWRPALLASDKNFGRRRSNKSDHGNIYTNRFSSHASVSSVSRLSSRGGAVIFLGSSSLDKKDGDDFKVDFAVKSLPDAFEDLDGDFELTAPAEKRAISNLGAAVSRAVAPRPDWKGKDAPEMRAFVLADADALSDVAFMGNELNQLFAVDLIRWLGGEESFAGSITSTEDVRIEQTKSTDQAWFYATIFGAPSLLLGVGLLVTRRKRQKATRIVAAKEKKA